MCVSLCVKMIITQYNNIFQLGYKALFSGWESCTQPMKSQLACRFLIIFLQLEMMISERAHYMINTFYTDYRLHVVSHLLGHVVYTFLKYIEL